MTHIHTAELFIYVFFAVFFGGFMLPSLLVSQQTVRRLYLTYKLPPIAPGPMVYGIVCKSMRHLTTHHRTLYQYRRTTTLRRILGCQTIE
jgi:hypothetical protein